MVFQVPQPEREACLKQAAKKLGLMGLLDKFSQTNKEGDRDVLRVSLVKLPDDLFLQLLHHLSFQFLASHHQVLECVEASYTKVVTLDDSQLGQDGKNNASQLEMIVHKQLGVLHERLDRLVDLLIVSASRELPI